MADVLDLRAVRANVRCPRCASPNIRRDAKVENDGLFKLLEWCSSCDWRAEPVYVSL